MKGFAPLDRRNPAASISSKFTFSRSASLLSSSDGDIVDAKGPFGLTTVSKPLEDVVADLVFVHGLGGGSRKTWSKNEDPALFWPQEWLPQDPEFKDVRIHTFGYDSNWNKQSVLGIHDFAKSLLEWIRDCPSIPRDAKNPIVLVCHSLGGLVAKRAYILARQLSEYALFAKRLYAIFFLGTPHRGSNLAELLSRILQVSPGVRPFVTDLHPNSTIIQSINDEFPHHCQDLQLYSFYETVPMNVGIKKIIIVPKDSAVLGYSNERTTYLHADHREMCKYTTEEDSNYLTVRNALASTIAELRKSPEINRSQTDYEQQQWLSETLDVDDAYRDEYQRVDSMRVPGSCEWILARERFQTWLDSPNASIYWITAKPGTGKSVLSSFVSNHLLGLDRKCAFYYFSSGDKSKSNISLFLRSTAWQLSSMHPRILDHLTKVCKKDPRIGKADYRTIWRKLFLEGIFKLDVPHLYYWVIDALDECRTGDLVPWLIKAAETNVVRVFVTSRNRFESYGEPVPPSLTVIPETIPQNETNDDIALYLNANIDSIPALGLDKDEARARTMRRILEKSAGCFLWARLVLHELRQVHTAAEIRQVLEDVPSDMDYLYTRIVGLMSTSSRGNRLAKAILTWTTCSVRPMTVDELYHALQIDIEDGIDSVQRSIISTCGQLVYIDANTRVQMVHQTARDFLLRPDNPSEFAVDKRAGHKRLATVCIQYLNSGEMAGPKSRKLTARFSQKERCSFVAYACTSLWEHIAFISSEDDEFLSSLAIFLSSSNVLSWIEYIAKHSDLNRLIQAGTALRHFVQRRARHLISLGRDVRLLDMWAVDLIRLVTKFGQKLLSSPSSIFRLIPPFCPSDTAIKGQFAISNRSISVTGLSATTWDDCSCTITQQQGRPSALACSDRVFAIGLSDGQIKIYDETTCLYRHSVSHGGTVKMLRFGRQGDVLASAARASICIWNALTWEQLWKFDIEANCMSLTFVDDDRLLLGTLRDNRLFTWSMETGLRDELPSWVGELDDDSSGQFRRPIAIAFSEGPNHLAIAYRGHDIIVWDVEEERIFDIYGQDTGSLGPRSRRRLGVSTVSNLEFSRASDAGLLAAACNDGELLIFNTTEGTVQASASANANILVSSADGLTLACGNSGGTIQIFEFDTLRLMHQIQSEEFGIKDLVFSADSHRLIDIRGPHCRVWDPSVLVRQEADEDVSDTISVSTGPQDYKVDDAELAVYITAFACADNPDSVFCGKVDGSVCQYDAKSGQPAGVLFRHSIGVSVVSLSFDSRSRILISADSSSRFMAYQLVPDRTCWSAGALIFDHRTGAAIDHILTNAGCTRMLVSSSSADHLWSIEPNNSNIVRHVAWDDRRRYRWSTHARQEEHLLLIVENIAHIYEWDTLARLTKETGIRMEGSIIPELFIRSIMPCFDANITATTFAESTASRSKSRLMLWNTSDLSIESESAVPIPHFQPVADQVDNLIGEFGDRLILVDHDGWVCSADPQSFDVEGVDRHFFFPSDWLSTTADLMMHVYKNGNVIFVLRNEIAIIKRGIEHSEQHHSKRLGKRPSLAKSVESGQTMSIQ